VDVVVIGGGNTGITAAYLLKKAGCSVALIERDRFAAADTAHTSAHLTYVTDLRVRTLLETFGRDSAGAVWDAGLAAIRQIEHNIQAEQIDCDFARVPGYLYASLHGAEDETSQLREEAGLACELGFPAAFVDAVPVFSRPGVCFPDQAQIHPLKYLAGLLDCIPGGGCHAFELTEAGEFTPGVMQVTANGHALSCGFVVMATDVPLTGRTHILNAALLQSKLTAYTSYVIGAQLPKDSAPDALLWDTSDPYFYLRRERQGHHDHVIFGGADHKTGQDDSARRFRELEALLRRYLPHIRVEHRWSGQVIESVDGLPFIGETAERQFVATGFSGNGLTFGTLAAMMACDAACGKRNPWQDLFSVHRSRLSSAWNYVRENADYPYYLIKDRLSSIEDTSTRSVKRGQGRVLNVNGRPVAAFRDNEGRLSMHSACCTHLGCLVRWNDVESTWDCPCHGSRFRATGEVLAGPAETPLESVELTTGPRRG
jgi:glycine/D-amino acid oxidase-like deaminating enzyme/nitrite reductase/ring-hydroxylating ferredoxin subunit